MPARFTSFLVKVASRCNLDCDYCYVYHHADQSWRALPKVMSSDDRSAFCLRLADYLRSEQIKKCAIIFHGGEPLLAGGVELACFAEAIRAATDASIEILFGMQTNGLLLTEEIVRRFEEASIAISLSLDGPRQVNDLHRTTRKGRSSFERVIRALELLKKNPRVFAGVIAVIDPAVPPDEVLKFFNEHQPPKLDFLLPDAHHLRPPPQRLLDADLYARWLIRAMDLWIDRYPTLQIRTFEALLDAIAGLPSGTDAFGLGDVSLLSIETDGTYHDLDVLKITRDGGTMLFGSVRDTDIQAVAASQQVEAHRRLLSEPGLCRECRSCPEMKVCGGGSVPHRYGKNGFDNPTIYCREMLQLIGHARRRLRQELDRPESPSVAGPSESAPPSLDRFERAETSGDIMSTLCRDAQRAHVESFKIALGHLERLDGRHRIVMRRFPEMAPPVFQDLAARPGAVAWCKVINSSAMGRRSTAIDGSELPVDAAYMDYLVSLPTAGTHGLRFGVEDPWLRHPFGNVILFEEPDVVSAASPVFHAARDLIKRWRPALWREILQACRDVQAIQDPTAHPEKIVSFSDDSVPGALFVSVRQGNRLISEFDLADSLIHEHRHQKLYLLERMHRLIEPNILKVVSPWREDLRPPSGLLHAVFVFVELHRFWTHILESGPVELRSRCVHQLAETEERLTRAIQTLESCPLTKAGRELVDVLSSAQAGVVH